MLKRPPDEVIGPCDNPYLRRWWLFRPPSWLKRWLPVIYLHNIRRSDNARALHDHVGWNLSILLRGSYWELLPWSDKELRGPGGKYRYAFRMVSSVIFRHAESLHSLQLDDPEPFHDEPPFHPPGGVWTLWIRGPNKRQWGFMDPDHGWIPHHSYGREA